VLNTPLDRIPLPDEQANAVINLAALHHCVNRDDLFDEWHRLLKPGGRMVIADVEVDSPNGEFLNRVVNKFTPGGHNGIFLIPGQLSETFINKGYVEVEEQLESFVWNFLNKQEMIDFSRSLFGMLHASDKDISCPGSNATLEYCRVTIHQSPVRGRCASFALSNHEYKPSDILNAMGGYRHCG